METAKRPLRIARALPARIRFCEDATGNSMDIYYDGDGKTGPANYTSIFSYSSGIGDVLTATYGGKVGIGTVILAVFIGPIVQFIFKIVKFDVKSVKHTYFVQK